MTRLIASIPVETAHQVEPLVRAALADGADAIELRIDGYDGAVEPLRELIAAHCGLDWIITCRGAEEGGAFTGDTMQRVSRLIEAARGTGAYVDFEFADWRRSDNIRQKVLLAATELDGGRVRLVLSAHRFNAGLLDACALHEQLRTAQPDAVVKLAWMPADISDNFAAFDALRAAGMARHESPGGGASMRAADVRGAPASNTVALCMGEEGLLSRVLARKFGAWGSYASVGACPETAPGQLSVARLVQEYRWTSITPATKWYGVIADPVAHSMSPLLFNRLFAAHAIDAAYLPLRVRGADALRTFLAGVRSRPWLGAAGFSVTLPHKETALHLADDAPESWARRVGAANTLVVCGGRIRAYNTDAPAVADSLGAALSGQGIDPQGLEVDVLGAGGAARAVLAALEPWGCRIRVIGRRKDTVEALASEFGCAAADWARRNDPRGGVLINATHVGMYPNVDEAAVDRSALARRRLVFDLVYHPMRTALLREAESLGVPTLGGLDMFVRQAAAQFSLWTGRTADSLQLRSWVENELAVRASARAEQSNLRVPEGKGIVLIGYRGSGKTTVAMCLARLLRWEHVDTDERATARAGRSIREVFEHEGEAAFRRIERTVIATLDDRVPSVISVGGGAVEDQANIERLRRAGTVVWLSAAPETLLERIEADNVSASQRPALTASSGLDEIREVLRRRAPLYQAAADFELDTTRRTPQQAAEEIIRRIGL